MWPSLKHSISSSNPVPWELLHLCSVTTLNLFNITSSSHPLTPSAHFFLTSFKHTLYKSLFTLGLPPQSPPTLSSGIPPLVKIWHTTSYPPPCVKSFRSLCEPHKPDHPAHSPLVMALPLLGSCSKAGLANRTTDTPWEQEARPSSLQPELMGSASLHCVQQAEKSCQAAFLFAFVCFFWPSHHLVPNDNTKGYQNATDSWHF